MRTRGTGMIVSFVAALALLIAASSTVEMALAGTVASKISYQGRLTDASGNPLNGSFNLIFQLWDDATGGSQVGSDIVKNISVNNGLFTVQLEVPHDEFYGQGLWLQIRVHGTVLTPRQELLPAPYALSLKPGAEVTGSTWDGPILKVENTNANPNGSYALVAVNASNNTWRPAIYGENTGGSAGIYGRSNGWHATVGYQGGSDPSHAGVWGRNSGAGPGVFGDSANSVGGYFISDASHALYGKTTSVGDAGVFGEGSTRGVVGLDHCSSGGAGVTGYSKNGIGVDGWSIDGPGGGFSSDNSAGVSASSEYDVGLHVRTWLGNNIIEGYEGWNQLDLRFRVARNGNVYADGTFTPGGADLAEMLPATEGLEPGDVLVIGPDGKLSRSATPYATNVVGVYSTKPGFLGGSDEDGANPGKVPLAVIGIVPVKASAENGPIAPGDLLTTSGTPGCAMRADHFVGGAILGKALEGLDESTGVLSMLVMLQ